MTKQTHNERTTWFQTFVHVILFSALSQLCLAQLSKPVVDTSHVGWGWFDLRMSGNSIQPKCTRWTIISADDKAFDLFGGAHYFLDQSSEYITSGGANIGPYEADHYDIFTKSIVGAPSSSAFKVVVRYTDGHQWSPASDTVSFSTPAAPTLPSDTVFVILEGHSALKGTHTSGLVNNFTGEYYDWANSDNWKERFGGILETELRRLTGMHIIVLNEGVAGSNLSDWIERRDSAYTGSGTYSDHKRFPCVAFFLGDNDCAPGTIPAADYSRVAKDIFSRMQSRGVKVLLNSVRFMDMENSYYVSREEEYHSAWQGVMSEYEPVRDGVFKGVDFYDMVKSNRDRFIGPDSLHPNISEGIFEMARQAALLIRNMLQHDVNFVGSNREDDNELTIAQPSVESLHVRMPAHEGCLYEYALYNVVGDLWKDVTRRCDGSGVIEFEMSTTGMPCGPYLLSASSVYGRVSRVVMIYE